jgi:hypothetical protein
VSTYYCRTIQEVHLRSADVLLVACLAYTSTRRWRQYVPPKRRWTSIELHDASLQNKVLFIVILKYNNRSLNRPFFYFLITVKYSYNFSSGFFIVSSWLSIGEKKLIFSRDLLHKDHNKLLVACHHTSTFKIKETNIISHFYQIIHKHNNSSCIQQYFGWLNCNIFAFKQRIFNYKMTSIFRNRHGNTVWY